MELEPPQFYSCMENSSQSIISCRALGLFQGRDSAVLKSSRLYILWHRLVTTVNPRHMYFQSESLLQPMLYLCSYPTL